MPLDDEANVGVAEEDEAYTGAEELEVGAMEDVLEHVPPTGPLLAQEQTV